MSYQNSPFTFIANGVIEVGRFVDITLSTGKIAYSSSASSSDAITVSRGGDGEAVSVHMIGDKSRTALVESEESITKGDDIEVGSNGKAAVYSAGTIHGTARSAGASGAFFEIMNK